MAYSVKVLDHFQYPRNVGSLDKTSVDVGTGLVGAPECFSGSTLIAAEKTGRICYGMELDERYVDVIIKRWEDYTHEKAEKC